MLGEVNGFPIDFKVLEHECHPAPRGERSGTRTATDDNPSAKSISCEPFANPVASPRRFEPSDPDNGTEDSHQSKVLVVIDEFARERLALGAGRTFTARDVMLTLHHYAISEAMCETRYVSVFRAATTSSRHCSHVSVGTWQVPTYGCPPPPCFSINAPMSVLHVRLKML